MSNLVEFLLAGFTDSSGEPLASGKVYTYTAGTTSDKATYTDSALVTAETNPIILDANGRKQVYANGNYKFVITDSNDATLYTLDNLSFLSDPKSLFDQYGDVANSGTSETDLYSNSIPANTLSQNGDKLIAKYGIYLPQGSSATRTLRVYFGGSAIFGSGAMAYISAGWATLEVEIIRVSSTAVRYSCTSLNTGFGSVPVVGGAELTGLTLSAANVLKITGQAGGGGASSDIIAKYGFGTKISAA